VKYLSLFLGLATISGLSSAVEPKVNYSMPVDPADLTTDPYVHNGLVLTDAGRGSGFVAEDQHLFFSAAHVVYDETTGWGAPPVFIQGNHGDVPDEKAAIQSRGYFRLNSYARLAEDFGMEWKATYSKDVLMGFAFEAFYSATPPKINMRGYADLRRDNLTFITGYPAEINYTGESGGNFLHTTAPEFIRFDGGFGNYVTTTHLSTGPGNSGGPVWRQDRRGNWEAVGVLVSGLTAETGVYGFTRDARQFLNAVKPLLRVPMWRMRPARGTSFSNGFYSMPRPRRIPDGRPSWTRIPLRVAYFPNDGEVSKVVLNLKVDTDDRSDLVVRLIAPGGTYVELFSLEDPGQSDLVFTNKDLSSEFAGLTPNGNWQLYIQDRIKGDRATVSQFELEISVDANNTTTPEEP